MQPVDAYLIAVIASALIPALYLIFAANGRLWRAVALWLAWPVLVYFVLIVKDTAAVPAGTYSLSDALLGLSLLSAFLILPWLAISAIVIGVALLIRKLVHRSDATRQNSAADLVPTANAASAAAAMAFAPDTAPYNADGSSQGSQADLHQRSPDGTISVRFEPIEWFNGMWLSPPRVFDETDGSIVLSLWGDAWDARVTFPAARQVILESWHFKGAAVEIMLDLDRKTYQILRLHNVAGPFLVGSLGSVASGFENAARRSQAASAALAGPVQRNAPAKVDWRALVTLIVGSVVVIAVIASVAVYLGENSPKPEPIIAVPEGGFRPK